MKYLCALLILINLNYANGEIIGYDDFKRKIVLNKPPKRIVVISVSVLDTICELGAGDKIIGVPDKLAYYYPETVRRYPFLLKKTKVGSSFNPNIEVIVSLKPNLVIIYDSFDNPGKFSLVFEKMGIPYAAFGTPKDLDSAFSQIKRLGVLLGKEKEAKKLVKKLKNEIDRIASNIKVKIKKQPLVYVCGGSGIFTFGKTHIVNELIKLAGGINLAGEFNKQFVELSMEYVISKNPDVIIVGYWAEEDKDKRLKEIKTKAGFGEVKAVKNNRLYALNGHLVHDPCLFSEALEKLARFIHPELFKDNGKKKKK